MGTKKGVSGPGWPVPSTKGKNWASRMRERGLRKEDPMPSKIEVPPDLRGRKGNSGSAMGAAFSKTSSRRKFGEKKTLLGLPS